MCVRIDLSIQDLLDVLCMTRLLTVARKPLHLELLLVGRFLKLLLELILGLLAGLAA